jgi:O-antigen/teichoic acid export membrane protein
VFDTVKNLRWVFLDKLVMFLIGIFVTAQIAKYFGPEAFGLFALAMTALGLLTALSQFGMNDLAFRELSKSDDADDQLPSLLAFQFAVAILVFSATHICLALELASDVAPYLKILSIIMVFKFADLIVVFFDSKLQSKFAAKARVFVFIPFGLAKLLAVWLKADVALVLYLYVAEAVVFALLLMNGFRNYIPRLVLSKRVLSQAIEAFRNSWVIFVSGLLGLIYVKLDLFIAHNHLSVASDLGHLAVSVRLIEAACLLPVIISVSLTPRIYNAHGEDEGLFWNKLEILIGLISLYGIAFVALVFVFAEIIIFILFGSEYANAANVLRVYALNILFLGFNLSGARFYIANNFLINGMLRNVIAIILVYAVGTHLAGIYGVMGVVYGTLAGTLYAGMIHDALFKKTRPLFFAKLRSLNIFLALDKVLVWRRRNWEF